MQKCGWKNVGGKMWVEKCGWKNVGGKMWVEKCGWKIAWVET
jgi:hypothetical protein